MPRAQPPDGNSLLRPEKNGELYQSLGESGKDGAPTYLGRSIGRVLISLSGATHSGEMAEEGDCSDGA